MKTWFAIALSVAAASASAQSSTGNKEMTAQQTRMATCNKEAGDRKGDERKAYMKQCLSAKPNAAKAAVPQPATARQ